MTVRNDILFAFTSLFFGGLSIVAGVVAIAADYPPLMVVMLTSIVLAILLGILARRSARQLGGSATWTSLASSGLLLGVVGLLCILLMHFPNARDKVARRTQALSNLKQISLALLHYEQDFGRLPPAAVHGPDGRPLYSWRVLILPYLGQRDLYSRFRLDEPWDGPHNRTLLDERPSAYDPVGVPADRNLTYYQVFIGPGTAFDGPLALSSRNVPDGLDRTLLVVEAGEPVPWTRPIDLPYLPEAQLPPIGGAFKARARPFDPGGFGGFHVLFADGSICFLSEESKKESTLRALITRNGGEAIGPPPY